MAEINHFFKQIAFGSTPFSVDHATKTINEAHALSLDSNIWLAKIDEAIGIHPNNEPENIVNPLSESETVQVVNHRNIFSGHGSLAVQIIDKALN